MAAPTMRDATGANSAEHARLAEANQHLAPWRLWGPYVSERAWGTVREDYSADGDAWSSFPHDQARSRAYRWSEDGIGGICDRHQNLCFALALWNENDPILKERIFGLTGTEGNHGEDVKECYFYLDSTPTHSYMKMLYKYPQAAFPYQHLIDENRRRSKLEPEYELVDTGIFNENRYFDVQLEYAKVQPEDILIRISISNRGPETAPVHVLPTLWFRNSWSWGRDDRRPLVTRGTTDRSLARGVRTLMTEHWALSDYVLYCAGADELLFTENETNTERLYGTLPASPYVKDAFHAYVIEGRTDAVNPDGSGTKAAAHYALSIGAGQTVTLTLRLAPLIDGHPLEAPFADFDALMAERIGDADEFYNAIFPANLQPDARLVARQAFGGMLWSKQFYHFVITEWLEGDPAEPTPPASRLTGRNHDWPHLFNRDVISMPDKWEFNWYASWDLGFHCITLSLIDPQFAKDQIILMLREWYMHPNGQIPAYEWNFNDVNPPVLSLAALHVFEVDRRQTGVADYEFLERVFQKMLLNFTWWVNRKDEMGNNVFEGGFLGMDNIGAFDRNTLPPGYLLGQADGTSWMAAFAKNMTVIALILGQHDPVYADLALKFGEHFIFIGNAMNSITDPKSSLWDEQDGFFYDYLRAPNGESTPVRGRTMVGFVPLFGITAMPAEPIDPANFPDLMHHREWLIRHRPSLIESVGPMTLPGSNHTLVLELVRPDQLRRLLGYMLDEDEFLSPHGIRAVSKYHDAHPLVIDIAGQQYRLDYEPGESTNNLFGGNSNWRGPIWMPVNFLIISALDHYYRYYGDDFQVECPTGSGTLMNLQRVSNEIARRVTTIFLRDDNGKRAVFGDQALYNDDPHWRDLIPFHEYFHGDTGRGCGASHQTGWTGLIAPLLMVLARHAVGGKDADAAPVQPAVIERKEGSR